MGADKAADLSDLMWSRAGMKWSSIGPEIPHMTTQKLVETMRELRLYVNRQIAEEIVKRSDSVFWLRRLLQDGRTWYEPGVGWIWTPIHAMHILAVIKTKDALACLLDVIRFRGEELTDSLTENVPGLLAAFSESGIEQLEAFTEDETLEACVRGAASTALALIARNCPGRREEIKEHLWRLFRATQDPAFAGNLVGGLATFGDLSLKAEIERAFEEGRVEIFREDIDEFFRSPQYFEEHVRLAEDPLIHFSREHIEFLESLEKRDSDEEPREGKTGRNDPCPCGSGKKYKKCCLGKGV